MAKQLKEKRLIFEENEEIRKQQNYWIAKKNDLITHSRYSLTLSQQRLLLFLISKIKPFDIIQDNYSVKIKDIIDVCEYNTSDSGNYYTVIKKDLLILRNSAVWIETERGLETMGWLSKIIFKKPPKGKEYQEVIFRFDDGLEPYLFQLQELYTQYNLENILLLSHKYSIRLYEYLVSYGYKMFVKVPIDDLRIRLDAQSYTRFDNFERRIIIPAIEDINDHTNIFVRYDKLRIDKGSAYSHIAFYIWGVNEDSKDYKLDDMRIIAGTKANIERREIKRKKRQIDKQKAIEAEGKITAQTSLFED